MMAEVGDAAEVDDVQQKTLRELHSQFFEMVPIRRMKWKSQVTEASELGPEVQRLVLEATVAHPLCHKYPPCLTYQKTFMKQFLHLLERLDVDICDEVYEQYTELLSQEEEEDDTLSYKTYQLVEVWLLYENDNLYGGFHVLKPCGSPISLQESVHLISQGTTGLSTWQAAQHLAEWSFENSDILENRTVLELGSGLGLTGIAICKQCQPSQYHFTDCHPQVLFLLAKNIELNLADGKSFLTSHHSPSRKKDVSIMRKIRRQLSLNAEAMINELGDIVEVCMSPTTPPHGEQEGIIQELLNDLAEFELSASVWNRDSEIPHGTLKKDPRISLSKLDWEEPNPQLLSQLSPDIVLAADVVYDASVIPYLVQLLKTVLSRQLLSTAPAPVAYIASTVRNEDTRDQFLYSLGKEDLKYEVVAPPCGSFFHYDRSVPIEIVKIYA